MHYLAALSIEICKTIITDSVHATLMLNGQALSKEKIARLNNNEIIWGPEIRIREATNVIRLYKSIGFLNPWSQESFQKAHREAMKDIQREAGSYRTEDTAIMHGTEPIRMAPPPDEVFPRMERLFEYLNQGDDLLLIKACLFHYRIEVIQPFQVGSGIMGRLWQTLLLSKVNPVCEFLSVERKLHEHRRAYFRVLNGSGSVKDATEFVYFMLCMINESLHEYMMKVPRTITANDRILSFHEMGVASFTRKDYMGIFGNISSSTASRDLEKGVNAGLFEKRGAWNRTTYSCKKP